MSEGIALALAIQREHPPAMWKAALAAAPEEHREEAAEYLRGMWQRHQTLHAIAAEMGVRVSDFDALRKHARRAKFNNIRAYVRWCRATGKNPHDGHDRTVR